MARGCATWSKSSIGAHANRLATWTVNPEIFARIIFSRMTLKDIFATFLNRMIYQYQSTKNDFSISRGFIFTKLRKCETSRKFPDLQYLLLDSKHLASLSTCMYPSFVSSAQQWRCAFIIRIMSFFLTQIIILTPFCLFMTRLSPCSVFSVIPSLICALRRKPFDTWYCSTAFSLFPSACSSLNVAAGTRLNAPSSGANTVYGPRGDQMGMLIPLINMLNESYTKQISCIFHIILRFWIIPSHGLGIHCM